MRARVKFHRFSGDVEKAVKIAMLEDRPRGYDFHCTAKAAKSFRKVVLAKARAVLKRQAQEEIEYES